MRAAEGTCSTWANLRNVRCLLNSSNKYVGSIERYIEIKGMRNSVPAFSMGLASCRAMACLTAQDVAMIMIFSGSNRFGLRNLV